MEPLFYERIFRLQKNHWWYIGRKKFLDVLLRMLPKEGLLLDAGCGPGSMLHYFSGFGKVVGVDRYAPALAMARSHFSGPLLQGDCASLPFADSCFTMVAACEVLYHRNIPDVTAVVREFARVLKPGGFLLLVDSAYGGCYSDHDVTAHGARRFTKREIVAAMQVAGLEVVHSTYAYALLLPLVWLVRRFKAWAGGVAEPGAELSEIWKPLSRLIVSWFAAEAEFAGRWGLPFGLSIQVLGRKPEAPEYSSAGDC